DRQRQGGRRPVPVRHREQPQGPGGDHAIRVRPEDGAAEVHGGRAVCAGELGFSASFPGAPKARARNDGGKIDRRLTIWDITATAPDANAGGNLKISGNGERRWPSLRKSKPR